MGFCVGGLVSVHSHNVYGCMTVFVWSEAKICVWVSVSVLFVCVCFCFMSGISVLQCLYLIHIAALLIT